jgi:hypothetical protein
VQRRGAEIPFAMRVFERVFPALDGGQSTHRLPVLRVLT